MHHVVDGALMLVVIMNNQETSSEVTSTLLVDLLKPVIKQAVADAMAELSEQVKPRSPKPFNVQEASVYLDTPLGTLYQLTSKKQIPFHKRGRKLFFYQDELDNWIKEGRQS